MRKEILTYVRVGSKDQAEPSLKNQLERIKREIQIEENVMKILAADFQDSSEKYNNLRHKQRSLLGQLYAELNTTRPSEKGLF